MSDEDQPTAGEESSERSQSTGGGRLSRRGALAALTGLGALGLGSQSATAGSGDHLGESWSGDPSANHGLRVEAQGGTQFGFRGIAAASDGRGVLGRATSTTGSTRGVIGRADSHGDNAAALLGIATASSGRTYGFQGRSDSYEGRGALGLATASTGSTIGMEGRAASESGTALRGFAYASSGSTFGVRGKANSPDGTGALGWANSTSGTTTGVRGRVDSSDDGATAVEGEATDSSGVTYGVKGTTASNSGFGLYTPDDASVEGALEATTVDTTESDFKLTTGTTSTGDARNVVAGHANNAVNDGAVGGTVGGGGFDDASTPRPNLVYDDYGTVAGGFYNQAGSDDGDPTTAEFATVGGGRQNTASAKYATVDGGYKNIASGKYATGGGGSFNDATAESATASGGRANTASASGATVGGGKFNTANNSRSTVGGGYNNDATGVDATVAGGNGNTASGQDATVPGGQSNTASGDQSLAAGKRAKAANTNAFSWNDDSLYHDFDGDGFDDGFSSAKAVNGESVTGQDTFNVSAQGGVRFVTGNSSVTYIPSGSTGWSTTSSRAVKTNVDPVDPGEALAGVESLEVATWEYEDEDGEGAGTTHVGPMAEDFHDAFDVGDSEGHINSINADGVALAAIQGLSAELDEKDEQIDDLATENEQLRERLAALEEEVRGSEAAPADD